MKKFIERCLARNARRLLRHAQPTIIGITGSVGKSSAKQAIAAALSTKQPVRSSPGNYNTEIGVPLAILGLTHPGRSYLGWLKLLVSAGRRGLFGVSGYPKLLVLEMAADKPGDISYLTGIARPQIAVVTAIGESHLEKFITVEAIVKEKGKLLEALAPNGLAVLNRDDAKVWEMRSRTKAKTSSFGFDEEADVRGTDLAMSVGANGECGMRFKVTAGGSTVPMFLPGVLGATSVYAALAAVAVAKEQGMNLLEIAEGLRHWQPTPGRMHCLAGIKNTLIIDDSYNAAPLSAKAALVALRDLPFETGHAKFAVLGDMLELGPKSVEGHEAVGLAAFESGADYLVFVGERMRDGMRAAVAAGAPDDRVLHFATTAEAGLYVQEKMRQGDVVLVKGSRSSHMEAVVRELMAEPLAADDLLVR